MNNIWFKIIAGTVAFVAIVWGFIAVMSKHPETYATAVASKRDLTETVTANGTVKADQEVSLAFTEQGLVKTVNIRVGDQVKKGDILASLDNSSLEAQLAGAQADVLAAEAGLSTAEQGTRPEELAIYKQKYTAASSAFITAMKDSYLSVEDAVLNKADPATFTNGATANPTINIRTQSSIEQLSIDNERVSVSDALNRWKSAIDSLDPNATSTDIIGNAEIVTSASLSTVKAFINRLGTIANDLSVGNSGMTQTTINTVIAQVNAAAQEITGAVTAEQSAESAWSGARDTLALQEAGSTPQAIQVAQAALAKAQAEVLADQSQIDHSYLAAPFDGTVTNVDFKIGEVYVPGISADESIGLLTTGAFKVEAYVPETDIGKIAVGDTVAVTFDSYGPSQTFPASVSIVNPAATVNDGANAYKVTAVFDDSDARIRSGLSANLSITVATATDALAVPTSAVITRGSSTYVLVKNPADSSFMQKQVSIGITTDDGYTQILSGLNEGDVVAVFGSSYQSNQ
ncbi:MAG: efflux RND transporter periplasmic adaptor subunit [Patescibacteria group bacterium]|nr:efflux RND transporter periplasmic adaptor subunit [Patescibacteria group bacterium]